MSPHSQSSRIWLSLVPIFLAYLIIYKTVFDGYRNVNWYGHDWYDEAFRLTSQALVSHILAISIWSASWPWLCMPCHTAILPHQLALHKLQMEICLLYIFVILEWFQIITANRNHIIMFCGKYNNNVWARYCLFITIALCWYSNSSLIKLTFLMLMNI